MNLTRHTPLTLALLFAAAALAPAPAYGASCSDYDNQAQAQQAADTRDADGDGIYCEALPCPCAKPGDTGENGGEDQPQSEPEKRSCVRTRKVFDVGFSKTKYPEIRAHYLAAVQAGWPRTLVLNRRGAEQRRGRLLDDPILGLPTKAGYDRDEYPPAVGRGRGPAKLRQGSDPTGWKASVRYVPSSENRSHGSTMGVKLRRFCDGQKFRYVFY